MFRARAAIEEVNFKLSPVPCTQPCSCTSCQTQTRSSHPNSQSTVSALPSQESIISALYSSNAPGANHRFPANTLPRRARRCEEQAPPPYTKVDPKPELSAPLREPGKLVLYVSVPEGPSPAYTHSESLYIGRRTRRRPVPLIQL